MLRGAGTLLPHEIRRFIPMAQSSAMRGDRRVAAHGDCRDGQPEPPNAAPDSAGRHSDGKCGRGAKSADPSNQEPQDQVPARGSARPWRAKPRPAARAKPTPAKPQPPDRPRAQDRRTHIAHRGQSGSGLFVASRVFPSLGSLQDPCSSPRAECPPNGRNPLRTQVEGGVWSSFEPSLRGSSSRRKIAAKCSGTPSATMSAYVTRNCCPSATMMVGPSVGAGLLSF
jgi:hypothetical protein